MKIKPLKVSELNNYIRKIIYSNPILNNVTVSGEVRDLRKSKSGYIYFNLSDEESMINCISFDSSIEIVADKIMAVTGKIETYDKRSIYQLVVYAAEEISEGLESKYLKELKDKLYKKGYFDDERKKALPIYPKKIGIVTSLEGAVTEDIKRVLNECNVGLKIYWHNAYVQGRSAVYTIVSAIKYFNEVELCDVMILARGGGSKVDLETFNDEILADTIYKSKVPIITGIGHGTDLSIADLTADKEVQTPTAAAEAVIRNYNTLINGIPEMKEQLIEKYKEYVLRKKYYVNIIEEQLSFVDLNSFLRKKNDLLDSKISNILLSYQGYIISKRRLLDDYNSVLQRNDLNDIFNKGFVFLRDEQGDIITDLGSLEKNRQIFIENMDFYVKATTTERGDK
jgi:exodeoxyribonuclease VII large subunit